MADSSFTESCDCHVVRKLARLLCSTLTARLDCCSQLHNAAASMHPGGCLLDSSLPAPRPCHNRLGTPTAVPRPHLLRHRLNCCRTAQRRSRQQQCCNARCQSTWHEAQSKQQRSHRRSWRTLAGSVNSVIDSAEAADSELDVSNCIC